MIRVAQHTNVSAIRISVQLSQHVNKERACSVDLLKFKTRSESKSTLSIMTSPFKRRRCTSYNRDWLLPWICLSRSNLWRRWKAVRLWSRRLFHCSANYSDCLWGSLWFNELTDGNLLNCWNRQVMLMLYRGRIWDRKRRAPLPGRIPSQPSNAAHNQVPVQCDTVFEWWKIIFHLVGAWVNKKQLS